MYAYCNNNPVVLIDDEGSAPWSYIIPDWGYVHRAVQQDIIMNNRDALQLTTEEKICMPSGNGRGDICRISTGEVWEVKYCGKASFTANAQLDQYTTGVYKNGGRHVTRGKEKFSNKFVIDNLSVTYWTVGNGIILYDFQRNPKPQKTIVLPKPNKISNNKQGTLIQFPTISFTRVSSQALGAAIAMGVTGMIGCGIRALRCCR